MEEEFDWKKVMRPFLGGIPRRRLLPSERTLQEIGATMEYWTMVEFFGDIRDEHPAFDGTPSLEEALRIGIEGVEVRYRMDCKQRETLGIALRSPEHLKTEKELMCRVICAVHSGDPIARQVDKLQDSVRGGDGDLYRRISEERKKTGGM